MPGQIIVGFSDSADQKKIHEVVGGSPANGIAGLRAQVVKVPAGRESAFISRYESRPGVVYAEEDPIVRTLNIPNDPFFNRQWGLHNASTTIQPDSTFTLDSDIDAPEAWVVGTPPPAKVAILDTGIDQDHPDLSSRIVGQNNFSTSPKLDDLYGHGTHVAGIAAAIPNNSVGVSGVVPNAQLLNGKVLSDTGSGSCSSVANGIVWAADQGAKVISLSLGGGACTTEANAVQYASNKGSLIVAAAGNSGTSSTASSYPAAYQPTLAVASTDNSDLISSFSNFGSWVEMAAPGQDIYSTFTNHRSKLTKGDPYGYMSGTSMATPFVAGAAALVQVTDSNGNGRTNDELRARLLATSDRPGSVTSRINGGRLNICRAVKNSASC